MKHTDDLPERHAKKAAKARGLGPAAAQQAHQGLHINGIQRAARSAHGLADNPNAGDRESHLKSYLDDVDRHVQAAAIEAAACEAAARELYAKLGVEPEAAAEAPADTA